MSSGCLTLNRVEESPGNQANLLGNGLERAAQGR
jgi:hypothetical protein